MVHPWYRGLGRGTLANLCPSVRCAALKLMRRRWHSRPGAKILRGATATSAARAVGDQVTRRGTSRDLSRETIVRLAESAG